MSNHKSLKLGMIQDFLSQLNMKLISTLISYIYLVVHNLIFCLQDKKLFKVPQVDISYNKWDGIQEKKKDYQGKKGLR